MLGVGWTEMLVIGVVALIVIGPKELPGLMHKVGKFAGTIRRMGQDFQRELNKTTGLDEVKNLRASITAPLKATTDAIRKEFNTTTLSGEVKPSGALKPADPNAESVVDEIKTVAGMKAPAMPLVAPAAAAAAATPAPTAKDAMKDAVSKRMAAIEEAKAAPATKKSTPVKAAPRAASPAKPKATPKKPAAATKSVEGTASAKPRKPATKSAAVKMATAEATPATEVKAPARRKAAVKKPAAPKPTPAAKA